MRHVYPERPVRIFAALMLISSASFAQSAPTGADSGSSQLQEVIVTAQRREQNLQDVPIAITNLTAAQIEAQQINATSDIPRLVPNMFTNNNTGTGSGNVYFLRGLGQTESFATFDPQVGQYVDDIYIGRGSAANFGLFDVDQIQVLRGPQGTLFGRNATGGAIVINTTKPGTEAGGYVEGGYGAYDREFGKAAVDLPINDVLFTRTAVSIVKDRGYVDDAVEPGTHFNFHDDKGIRESILYKPSDTFTWNVTADASESKFNAEQNSPLGGNRVSFSGEGNPNAAVPVLNAAPIISDINGILGESFTNLPNGEDFKSWGAMSHIDAKFDAGTLSSITGLRAQSQMGAADFPFPSVSGSLVPYDNNELGQFGIFLNSVDRQFSQELKFSGNVGDRFNYTTGLFYLFEENRTVFMETLTVPVGPATAPSVFGLELSAPENFHNTTKSAAAYFQGDFKVTDALTLTAGARFTDEQKAYDVFAEPSLGGGASAAYDTADVQAAGHPTSLKTNQFTPRFVAQYKLDPDVMLFASATKGFQGGGWNSLTGGAETVTAFTPETVWTYESGVRTEWLDKTLVLNADVFYNDVRDYQLITLGPGNGNFVTENAANMSAYGLEADLSYKPIENLTFTGTFGLQDGTYYKLSTGTQQQLTACRTGTTADCGQGIISPIGTIAPPENFPHSTFALNGNYVWKQDRFDLTPGAAVQFTSKVHTDTQDSLAGVSEAHTLLDLSLKFHAKDAPWYVVAECQNCMMKNYVVSDLFVQYWNTPGIWDVKVRYDF